MPIQLNKPIVHDPEEVLDYSMSWADALETGESISDSEWSVVSGTATLASSYNGAASTTADGTINSSSTTVWVVTASLGDVQIKNHITTSAGRQYERTANLTVRHQ